MGLNEILIFVTGVLCAMFIFVAWRINQERLYTAIVIFLILIASVGAKLVEFWGYETNTGNIFYASVFLATYFLIERYGKREGLRSIWVGVAFLLFFSVLVQLAIALVDSGSTGPISEAFSLAFSYTPRFAIASLSAYLMSQSLNVYLYIFLKEEFPRFFPWLRANLSNAVAQILDSMVFFLIAFWGTVPPANLVEIIMTGYVVKVIFMLFAAPLLHLNKIEQIEENGQSTLVIRYDRV